MSRRRGEFEHRTSIFEGAFRAWSHLGGLEPADLETLPNEQLDPLVFIIENDPRLDDKSNKKQNSGGSGAGTGSGSGGEDNYNGEDENGELKTGDGSDPVEDANRRIYPYEPLPRSGLAHPFVQAILSPWLGPDAEQDAIQLGLTTLRTWWQHRRKGESGSAIVALGTEKMRGVVDGYTRHFFNLAYCLVMKDGEQPPRTLMGKMKEVEKVKNKKVKKRAREEETGKLTALALNAGLNHGIEPTVPVPASTLTVGEPQLPQINMQNQCVPGKVDLPELVQQISNANQLVHRGNITPLTTLSNVSANTIQGNGASTISQAAMSTSASIPESTTPQVENCGNPNTYPIVFISEQGDPSILMSIDGITCAHCVKIVETVLKGCTGTKSPINGLLDCVADQMMKFIIIKIDSTFHAKRIGFDAARNLSMVGYNAQTRDINVHDLSAANKKEKPTSLDTSMVCTAFEVVGSAYPMNIFDWSRMCTCSPLGVEKESCPRHNQMNSNILEFYDKRKEQILLFMSSCSSNDQGSGRVEKSRADPTSSNALSQLLRRNSRLRQSITSEATFGRAMSGLSALSIDWENMEDFDVNIDHSSHINNNNLSEPLGRTCHSSAGGGPSSDSNVVAYEEETTMANCAMLQGGECDCGPTCICVGCPIHDKSVNSTQNLLRNYSKRPSILRSDGGPGSISGQNVSFKT